MSIYWNEQRKRWCYAFNINKQRYTGYCEHPETKEIAKTKRDAKRFENLIRADVQRKTDRGEETKRPENLPKGGFTLAEPLAYHLEKMEGRSSYPNVKCYVAELLAFFGPETPMETVEDRIHEYIEFSKKQKVKVYKGKNKKGKNLYQEKDELRSAKSINEYLKCLRKAYRDFKKAPENRKIRRYIPDPPEFDLLKVPKRTPTPVPYNVTQKYLEAFDDKLHAHTRLAYILCVQTGMRARECAEIRERQYYETERVIALSPDQTKTDTGRFVHVNDVAHEALMECRKVGDYLWDVLQEYPHLAEEYRKKYGINGRGDINFILFRRNGTGVPRPVKHVATTAWKTIKKTVGIDYRWHDTRAAICSDTLGGGGDINAVRQLAGHQDIHTTQKYLHAADPHLKKAVKNLAAARPLAVPKAQPQKISAKVAKGLEKAA